MMKAHVNAPNERARGPRSGKIKDAPLEWRAPSERSDRARQFEPALLERVADDVDRLAPVDNQRGGAAIGSPTARVSIGR
jgi:hypothetical protein